MEALIQPNVKVFNEQIHRITKKGFLDSKGKEYEVDAIICATGFDTTWVPRFPIVHEGKNVQDFLRQRTISYLAMAVPEGKPKVSIKMFYNLY